MMKRKYNSFSLLSLVLYLVEWLRRHHATIAFCHGPSLASRAPRTTTRTTVQRRTAHSNNNGHSNLVEDVGQGQEPNNLDHILLLLSTPHRRRTAMRMALLLAATTSLSSPLPSLAGDNTTKKLRSQSFVVLPKTDDEWKSLLTPRQYEILRKGGTERPYSSILEAETRPGIYSCAGCGTALFDSAQKFKSGTGWPSFAASLEGVQVEPVNFIQLSLKGAELQCRTCGGHLGDVFNDGFLFVGTPAAQTGKRFCIDGAALLFQPADGSPEVVGDQLPAKK
ncbi:methionine-R-sulfoxide reductase [Nitzschia inconspicua]|uniref:Peptide-methionine (R)-S-oxide reductase n=1 Tax=Nitzschia inconspicua TaxID=303405 RepID=A0A9K3LGD0_9STRA|nr:methionine-R-sulfoxide reductase [Nitzschia inconspicua]